MIKWVLVTPTHGIFMGMAYQLYTINLCRVVTVQQMHILLVSPLGDMYL